MVQGLVKVRSHRYYLSDVLSSPDVIPKVTHVPEVSGSYCYLVIFNQFKQRKDVNGSREDTTHLMIIYNYFENS